jgi:hypothetical protein
VSADPPTVAVSMNEPAPVQYDVMADLLHASQVRIFAHDGCGHPGGLERRVVL